MPRPAMASDRPIIAHENTFNRATLEGCSVHYFSSAADLADSLRRLDGGLALSTEPSGRSCYEIYRQRYTWDQICARYSQVLGFETSPIKGGAR